jgi:hypothetical protein
LNQLSNSWPLEQRNRYRIMKLQEIPLLALPTGECQ